MDAGFFQYHRVSNSLDPDQAQHFVGPDLGPNCLQRLSADIVCKELNTKQLVDTLAKVYFIWLQFFSFLVKVFCQSQGKP